MLCLFFFFYFYVHFATRTLSGAVEVLTAENLDGQCVTAIYKHICHNPDIKGLKRKASGTLQTARENIDKMSLSTLPPELVTQILTAAQLPNSARLTCRTFNDILAKDAFKTLKQFLQNPEATQNRLHDAIAAMPDRPRAIWSPRCSIPPGLPISQSFLFAISTALQGTTHRSYPSIRRDSSWSYSDSECSSDADDFSTGGHKGTGELGQVQEILQLIGQPTMSQDDLRQVMFHYALFLSYAYQGEGDAPQTWVMHARQWEQHL